MHWAELSDDFNRPRQFEIEFVKAFGIPFQSVTNVDNLTNESYDDGVDHYINIKTKDVYSYKNKWLEKNAKRDEVLKRLPDDGVRPIEFLVSPEEQNLEIEKRIKSRKRPGMNPYGGMGMDGISEEERRLRMEEIQKYRVL